MRVILLQDVKNLGKRDEVREVKDGYARNFLIPKGLARPATSRELEKLEVRKEEHKEQVGHIEELAKKVEGQTIAFTLKADEKGSVFGSVTADNILEKLNVGDEQVKVLPTHPIKEFGEHKVTIRFREGIEAIVTVVVSPEKL